MSEKSSGSSSGGIGFAGLLAILFIALKLTKMIDWSWWWVLSPLWIGVALWLVIVGGIFVWALVSTSRKPRLTRR